MNPRASFVGVGLIFGFAMFVAGRVTAPGPEPMPAPAAEPACAEALRERDEEREVRQLLERELYGDPIAWPASVPPDRTEAGYRAALTEVVSSCRPTWTLGALDCQEPPCIAEIWPGDGRFEVPKDCPAWVDRYGPTVQSATSSVECGGQRRRLVLVSPVMVDEDPPAPVELENRSKRLKTRWAERMHDAKCPADP